MPPKEKQLPAGPPPRGPVSIGIDLGSTLAKLAWNDESAKERFEERPAADLSGVMQRLAELAPSRVGLTGGGAWRLAREVCGDRGVVATRVVEFDAWRAGVAYLAARDQLEVDARHLIISVGTGTSCVRVEGDSALRIGGTALGGGTLMGLGRALLAVADFEEMSLLAEQGRRGGVDLCIGDVSLGGELPLPADATAACLAKLARPDLHARPSREDLAAGIVGLVGENIGLIGGNLAATTGVQQVLLGGTTLRDNPALVRDIRRVLEAYGRKVMLLPHSGYVGALGALTLAQAPGPPVKT